MTKHIDESSNDIVAEMRSSSDKQEDTRNYDQQSDLFSQAADSTRASQKLIELAYKEMQAGAEPEQIMHLPEKSTAKLKPGDPLPAVAITYMADENAGRTGYEQSVTAKTPRDYDGKQGLSKQELLAMSENDDIVILSMRQLKDNLFSTLKIKVDGQVKQVDLFGYLDGIRNVKPEEAFAERGLDDRISKADLAAYLERYSKKQFTEDEQSMFSPAYLHTVQRLYEVWDTPSAEHIQSRGWFGRRNLSRNDLQRHFPAKRESAEKLVTDPVEYPLVYEAAQNPLPHIDK